MKDNRFIELVNLYIDRQISAAETAELEAEIQADPHRRAVYRQYCQMHRATTLVYDSFRAGAPGGQAPEIAAGRATIARYERPLPQRGIHWAYYATGLAAACLALVFVRQNSSRPAEANLAATLKASQPVAVAASQPPAPAKPREAVESRAGLASLRDTDLAVGQDYAAMLAALRQEEQRAFANGQIQSGRLPSLFEDGVFESPQGSPLNNQRIFRGKQSPAQQAEFTAFQFQR